MAIQRKRSRERGMAIIFYATMLFFVVGCVGLAVDVGTVYMIKARLSAATDAAALAAGRSVNLTLTLPQAQTNAVTTANQFFTANFPNNYFNTVGTPTVTPTLTQETDVNGNPNGVLDIKVTASATAPTYFMNIFDVRGITVSATGTASRRGLVMMLVLDQSSSMGTGAGSPCNVMAAAAQNFVTLFSPYDQIGLVTFDLTAHLMDPPTDPIATVSTNIGNIANNCGSNTNTITALELAYQQIKAVNLPLALNTIVLFTDGSPNGITANFPTMQLPDSRWGPALNPSPATPAQSGSTYGIANSCNANPPGANVDANGVNSQAICVNMPAGCVGGPATIFGTIAQWGDQNSYGAGTYGFAAPTDTSSVSGSCPGAYWSSSGTNMRQFIAYIPDADFYGNSLHGVVATSNTGTASGGMVSRDNWIFQVNSLCSPDPTVSPNCRNTGDFWTKAAYSGIGSGSNLFPAGAAYPNKFRPDQPNSVVAAGMNGTMAEANKIRSDTTFHPVINTIYLTGNTTDSVDREFLAIVANAPLITALPYDPVTFVPYTNPAYVTTQETGKYLVTSDRNMLSNLFTQLASEVLRLSK
jgi:Flp pilus assembly protein TadG